MSRYDSEYIGYQDNNLGSGNKNTRTRRKINNHIDVGNLDHYPEPSNTKNIHGGNSSNEESDYNVDDSENEDRPTISRQAATFNLPINQKSGMVSIII